ncbi:SAR2788 family putative toxin [Mammaliicoccus sciuri]|uniref:SAR2788 family putative toxin n=1 Tax=Mammaliicoccus sciuri TaxID=1296 RepID=UPI002DBED4E6|nr:SAR2788 family putative toxin [Mammaliicoccus sciuri]MEB8265353.1 SAR2788 family putative toxin [Mammaliicoccus sciuri]
MRKQTSKLILSSLSLVMGLTIFGGIEGKAEENEYELDNIKQYDLGSQDTNQVVDEINVKEIKAKEKDSMNLQGETENENFNLDYNLKLNGGYIELDNNQKTENYVYSIIEFKSEEDYKVSVKNLDTEEEIVYSASELKASNPLIIAAIIRYGVKYAVKKYGKNAVRLARNAVSKSSSPVWKKYKSAKNGRKTSGSGKNKRYYEWDNTQKEIEVYNNKGEHIGVMDPLTGKMIKPAVKGRKIKL